MFRSILRCIDSAASHIFNYIAIITTVSLVTLVFLMVLTRYVFNWSVFGLDELAAISAMWLYMFGALISSKKRTHIVVDFAPLALAKFPRLLKAYEHLIGFIMLVTAMFFMYLAWDLLKFSLRMPQHTAALSIPELISRSAVIIASIGCFCYALRDLITGKVFRMISYKE